MKKIVIEQKGIVRAADRENEKGSAIVIALFVLALISIFAALAMSRSSAEAAAVGNETKESKAFYAAQGSLEMMTRNFNKKFEINLKPTTADFDDVRTAAVPGLSGPFTFNQEVIPTSNNVPTVLPGGDFKGLYAKRDTWRLRTTATDNVGVQVQLTRNILNNLIPIFQFGIFYDDDLEFHPGPRFDFGGRVHSNGSLFMQAGDGLYFSSKVSAANFIFTDVSKNGSAWTNWDDDVYIKNASGTYVQLQYNMGSVLASPANGAPVGTSPAPAIPLPTAYNSTNWGTNKALFDGNLDANVRELKLPLKLNSDNTNQNLDLIEIVKRGKSVGDVWNNGTGTVSSPNLSAVTTTTKDDAITASERYYNKTGIRVSLADSKAKLPGCATTTATAVTTPCGIRLDGESTGQVSGAIAAGTPLGYQPTPMVAASPNPSPYQATKLNGKRFYSPNKETWIKIETVIYNPTTEVYDTQDITQDILSLGVTDAPPSDGNFSITDPNYYTRGIDTRSIIELQRYVIPGANINGAGTYMSYVSATASPSPSPYNYVMPRAIRTPTGSATPDSCSRSGAPTPSSTPSGGYDTGTIPSATPFFPAGFTGDEIPSMRNASIRGYAAGIPCVVPVPINMFDTREGLYNDTTATFDPDATYGTNVPWAGVMSLVDINVGNLKKFLDGVWDNNMPTNTPYYTLTGHVLRGNDIPQPTNTGTKAGGWVLYISDRRGDFDFDGEYDMEDVYGPNDGTRQLGEDLNGNNTLQADYANESIRYTGTNTNISPDIAAVFDHKFYRRGVRLVNAETIPGIYNTTTPANTRGFTVASENGVYVLGNYNATGVSSHGSPTAHTDYLPLSTSQYDIPASIAADSITILSRNWQDALSFTSPFNLGNRQATETTCRFAMLSGDTVTTLNGTPNQGGGDLKMNGGVHNFKRFLEDWGSEYLNYSGSLINLFNSHNNNGPFKCCNNVYSPPNRNWVFDATFLDINRLPPGTPYFQYIQTTGFQRTND
ncbi:MAG: pilus assembly PilX N-terminal domain-containing protein [Chloracidobacterium sp.]|nr:pilus assembly PilX N-terminal domain-containing protein [Chloracidobacterium sp.]